MTLSGVFKEIEVGAAHHRATPHPSQIATIREARGLSEVITLDRLQE